MTEYGGIEKFVEVMKSHRENVIKPYDLDYVWLNCGPERSGKSTLAIYVGTQIDPNFSIRNICSSLPEYFNLMQTSEYFGGDLPRGSLLVKDESTDVYAREFYSKNNIAANKSFITSGALNMMHCLTIPKPISIDQYLREERCMLMTYSYFKLKPVPGESIPKMERGVLVYFKNSINKIYTTPGWQKYFWSHDDLVRKFRPDGEFYLPNLVEEIEKASPGLYQQYLEKKKKYVQASINEAIQLTELEKTGEKPDESILVNIAAEINAEDLSAKEKLDMWKLRTTMGKVSFYSYAKKAALQSLYARNIKINGVDGL